MPTPSQVDFGTYKIPPLEPGLLKLDPEELDFLHATVASDDVELKRRILEVTEK